MIPKARSLPWYAPEWYHRGFEYFSDARKSEVFSVSLVYFRILFHDSQEFPGQKSFMALKAKQDLLLSTVYDIVKLDSNFNLEQK